MLMQHDIISIGQIVFRGKPVRRIEEKSQHKENHQNRGGPLPAQNSPPQRGYGKNDQQRISRQEVSREQRATQQRERDQVRKHDEAELYLGGNGDTLPF